MTLLEPRGIGLYLRAAKIYRELRQWGLTIRSTIDCIIAVLAEENGCHVLARDRDLETMDGALLQVSRPGDAPGPFLDILSLRIGDGALQSFIQSHYSLTERARVGQSAI
jgi:hypothetical protein